MKIPFLSCISLLAIVACTTQQSSTDPLSAQWAGAGQNAGPTHVGGSAANTTTAFDGTYRGVANRSASMAGTGKKTFGHQWPRAVPGYGCHICGIRDAAWSFDDAQRLWRNLNWTSTTRIGG